MSTSHSFSSALIPNWATVPLTGNFGVQYMYTDQSSDALAWDNATGTEIPVSGGDDWSEVLPSLNLTFDIGNDNLIRFSLARTVARARMDDLRVSGEFSFNEQNIDGTTPATGPWTGDAGNPTLQPWVANAVDLSYEKYFADATGYFSLAVFYKDLEQYVFDSNRVVDFTGFPYDETLGEPGTFLGLVNSPINGEGGDISGYEVSFQINGDLFVDALRDFGIVANYSNTDSSIQPDPDAGEIAIPGLSEEVLNVTLFYENERFGARVSNRYRSEFLGEVTGFGSSRGGKDVLSESIVDAQISYDFGGSLEGLSAFLQGFNLTDEPLRTIYNDDGRQINDFQEYGRSYMIGVSYTYE